MGKFSYETEVNEYQKFSGSNIKAHILKPITTTTCKEDLRKREPEQRSDQTKEI